MHYRHQRYHFHCRRSECHSSLDALSLESGEAVMIMMIPVWYSALLPRVMLNVLQDVVLTRVNEVCEKIKDKAPTSLQAKKFLFGMRTLQIVLKTHQ